MCQFHWLPGEQGTGSRNLSCPTNWWGKSVTEKRGIEIKNRQAQDLSLTKFLPIAMASCGQACCQDIFCRLSLSSSNWTLDGVSSPLELSMVDELVCFNEHNETSKENQKPRVPSWQWYFKGTMCSECCAGTYLSNKSCSAPSESVSPVSPVRPNRECRRCPTRVASVSAVCGMLSLRASMQVNGRCATDGNQDVIFPP